MIYVILIVGGGILGGLLLCGILWALEKVMEAADRAKRRS